MTKSISSKKHPKYQLCETVWVMKDNKPYSFIIVIILLIDKNYYYGESPYHWNYDIKSCIIEYLLFPSKEELIKSL